MSYITTQLCKRLPSSSEPHNMITALLLLILFAQFGLFTELTSGVAHFTLGRRGGRLATHENANLEKLAELVTQTEERYGRTYREFNGNRLARKRHAMTSGTADDYELVTEPGQFGRW